MSYSVDRFRGSATYTVEDGTIDSSLDIKLIGKLCWLRRNTK